jgi:surfeit locus 1 family protein
MMFTVPRPFPVMATLVVLAGVVILCSLGHWQQERLVWKTALQATLDQEFAKDASTTPLSADELRQVGSTELKRGTLSGRFDFSKQIFLQGQIANGKPVNHVLIPFLIDKETPVFVVAGYQAGFDPVPDPRARATTDRVTGVARIPQWSRFASENQPEHDKWYRADPAAMAQARSLDGALPVLFYLENSNYKMDAMPRVEVTRILKNDHRHYMIFWYTMAIVLTGIYILRFWRQPS